MYTDGSCLGNPGAGGWAFVLLNSEQQILVEQSGGEAATTNNRMEMTALLQGLKYLLEHSQKFTGAKVKIFSDSNLLVQTVNSGWKKKANLDLWLQIDQILPKVDFTLEWVKAHDQDHYNNLCDELARKAATIIQKQSTQKSA